MEKFLVTGFNGFVAAHFLDLLETFGKPVRVLGLDLNERPTLCEFHNVRWDFRQVNLLNSEEVYKALFDFQPDYVLHLASVSSVAHSWKFPAESFVNNTNIFLNLADAIRKLRLPSRLLSVGSSEEYGSVPLEMLPLREDMAVNPKSPYAVARVSQEMLSVIYAQNFNVDIVITRSFNHIGPGQKETFVIASFADQLVKIKGNATDQQYLCVGNIDLIRDFVDVRDVVKAYYLLLKKGVSGEIYNICSGIGTSLRDVIGTMQDILGSKTEIRQDSARIRPGENEVIIGDHTKITEAVGWKPEIPLRRSLEDIINYRSALSLPLQN